MEGLRSRFRSLNNRCHHRDSADIHDSAVNIDNALFESARRISKVLENGTHTSSLRFTIARRNNVGVGTGVGRKVGVAVLCAKGAALTMTRGERTSTNSVLNRCFIFAAH